MRTGGWCSGVTVSRHIHNNIYTIIIMCMASGRTGVSHVAAMDPAIRYADRHGQVHRGLLYGQRSTHHRRPRCQRWSGDWLLSRRVRGERTHRRNSCNELTSAKIMYLIPESMLIARPSSTAAHIVTAVRTASRTQGPSQPFVETICHAGHTLIHWSKWVT